MQSRRLDNRMVPVSFFLLAIFPYLLPSIVEAQNNYTVGDDIGTDHTAIEFAPYKWEYWVGNEPYRDHVSLPRGWPPGSGQGYEFEEWFKPFMPPSPGPAGCTIFRFHEIVANRSNDLGTLLIMTHGSAGTLAIEPYEKTDWGYQSSWDQYSYYIDVVGYSPTELVWGSTQYSWVIGVTDQFLINYAYLPGTLVYLASCQSATLLDEFIVSEARVAIGIDTDQSWETMEDAETTFFSRMDGKTGQQNRPVAAAKVGLNHLYAYGAQNTTLSPSVLSVTARNPLRLWDTITVRFDTKCNTWATPEIWCDWGDVAYEEWVDSTTLRSLYSELPPFGIDECELTLTWDYVWSARNWSCLDGNTDPPGGANAQGPAPDDYLWTMAVDHCYCGRRTPSKMWADLSNDNAINAVDVVKIVDNVYKGWQVLVPADGATHPNAPYPPGPPPYTCTFKLGDANLDGFVNPVDAVRYINYVYKGQTSQILDNPCGQ